MFFPRSLSGLALIAALAGCATSSGEFPSLAPRPAEKALADADEAPPVAPSIADDPALPARLDAFVAAGRRGQPGFDTALAAARRAVERAGARASDSWIEAQQAISRVETERSTTADALADLDAFVVERAKTQPLSAADQERVRQATEALQRIARDQQQALAALQARLGS